jgi:hypothetical protein
MNANLKQSVRRGVSASSSAPLWRIVKCTSPDRSRLRGVDGVQMHGSACPAGDFLDLRLFKFLKLEGTP